MGTLTEKYANMHGWTDIEPHEIVRVISEQTLEVRSMESRLDPTWKPEAVIGGFSSITTNNAEQKWEILPDETAPIFRIRYSKAKGVWQNAWGARFILSDKPRKFYDYNF